MPLRVSFKVSLGFHFMVSLGLICGVFRVHIVSYELHVGFLIRISLGFSLGFT